MINVKHNKGFALITALLIVALATIVSVNIASNLQLDIRRTSNILANEQAMLYALEAENLLRWGLYEDRQDNNFDYYRDPESLDESEKWSRNPASKDRS
jgi:general secretion pathway protein K